MKQNPYIGPRPFERGDQSNFYGREREARELQALIAAEHEVLVYAQSGAGKTSLFNARVIPALEAQGFDVLPVARVGLDLPPQIDPRGVENIFIYSALLSLAGQQADPQALISMPLATFLRERMLEPASAEAAPEGGAVWTLEGVPHPPVLIFDQFEELFTTHRERWQEADGFFKQVRAALDQIPELGVVFSMREDHIAALDPYLWHFSNRLRARFRLEPLGQRGALAGIARPAECAGVPFAPGVAEQLVDDLCRVKIQSLSGEEDMVIGPFVEPVQLQVVCSQLWANLPEETTHIQWYDVSRFGDVDRALTGFYESGIQAVTARLGIKEREVRRWFREQLITQVGTRGLALRGLDRTAGLPNEAVDILEDLHLICAEARAGARWYEISHDRLVDPILASNRAWERARQTPLRAAARRWEETDEKGLLLRGKALDEAEQWVKNNPSEVEDYEAEFLKASQQAEQAAARRRQQWVGLGIAGLLAVLAMAVLTSLAVVKSREAQEASVAAQAASTEAVSQRNQAEAARRLAEEKEADAQQAAVAAGLSSKEAMTQRKIAQAGELALQGSKAITQNRPQLGMQLALQSIALRKELGLEPLPEAGQALYDGLSQSSGQLLEGPAGGVLHLATQGDWLAAAGADGIVQLWNLEDPKNSRSLPAHRGKVYDLAFHPKDGRLATSGDDGLVRLWNVENEGEPLVLSGHSGAARVLAFSEDGRWLASGGDDGLVLLWDLSTKSAALEPFRLAGDGQPVRALAFQPGSAWLVTLGSQDKVVRFWDTTRKEPDSAPLAVRLQPPADMLRFEGYSLDQLNFSPNGRYLVVSGYGYYAFILDLAKGMEAPQVSPVLFNSGSYQITSAAFSADGCFLALQDRKAQRNEINLFAADPTLPPSSWLSYTIPSPQGRELAFGGTGQIRYLASAGVDNAVRLFDLGLFYRRMSRAGSCSYSAQGQLTKSEVNALAAMPVVLRGLDGDASALLDLPGRERLAAAGLDGSVRLWEYSKLIMRAVPQLIYSGEPLRTSFLFDTSQQTDSLVVESGASVDLFDRKDISKPVRSYAAPPLFMVQSAAVSPGGRWAFFYFVGKGRGAYMLDLQRADARIEPFTIPESKGISEIAFSPDGRRMAAIYEWTILTVWDLEHTDKGGKPGLIYGPTNLDPNRDCLARGQMKVAFDPTGRWLVVANASSDAEKSHYLYDTQDYAKPPLAFGPPVTGEEICSREKDAENIAFSPDGRWLVGPGGDGSLHLWDMQPVSANQPPAHRVLNGFDGQVKSLAFHPDGSLLVAGSSDFSLRAWHVADFAKAEEPVSTRLGAHESAIQTVRFSEDGQWLASLGADHVAQIWRVGPTLQPWVRFSNLYAYSHNIQFTTWDGAQAMLALDSQRILVAWPLDLDLVTAQACAQSRRELLPEDRSAYFPDQDPLPVCPVR